MKSLFVLLAIALSANSYAVEVSEFTKGSLAVTGIFTSTTSGVKPFGKLEQIIRDANEYHQNGGRASSYLAQQIRDLQKTMDISDDEAVDLLVEVAQEQMNLNY